MHTIRGVSQQLGLAAGTLRAWEQRYGIVRPTRTEGGYRLYDDHDIETLRAMADLVAAGMQPAQAAEQVRSRPAAGRRGSTLPVEAPAGLPDHAALIEASRSYDVRALEGVLDAAFAAAGFEYAVDGWLMPAMVAIGQAWAAGDLDVAAEHFISAGVMRRLAAAFAAAGHALHGRHVVTGLAPGATHEIGTLAFATMLRRAGLRVTYLGADLPRASWVQAVGATSPDAVVIGAPRAADTRAATDVALALLEAGSHRAIYIGGPGATPEHAVSGTTLAGTVDWLVGTLTTPRPGRRPSRVPGPGWTDP